MKVLVVYYSLNGNTRFIAQNIAGAVGADLLELRPVNAIPSGGFMRFFWGGRQAVMKQRPELAAFDKRPGDYDLLFIGTPVWAFTYAPALATFLSAVPLAGKKIALFCCHGGMKGKTLKALSQDLRGNEILGTIDFVEPLMNNKETKAEQARRWAAGFVAKT